MINGKIIKVCGMREAENIQDVESIEGIDMLGFIFYPKSPRCVYELPAYLPTHARRVGVFVNEDKQVVSMYADRFGLNDVQLHGNESFYRIENHQGLFWRPAPRLEKGV